MSHIRLIEQHPLGFALAALIVCLGVYSAIAHLDGISPLVAAGVAAVLAFICYTVSRRSFWPPIENRYARRSARVLAIAAVSSGVAVSALGILIDAWQPRPTDIPLWPMTTGSPPDFLTSLGVVLALCVLTGIFEEALFSAVLFGGLRRYYCETDFAQNSAGDNPVADEESPSPSLASRLTSRAAAVQGILFAIAHVAGGLIALSQGFSATMAAQIVVWFAGTFLFGIVTAVLMETGRSLALNAIVHAVYDFALFAPLAMQSGTIRPTTVTGDGSDLALFSMQACILAIAFVLIYVIGRRR